MNIIAINGSPRGANGNTFRMLDAIREGAQKVGAEMEIVHLSEIDMRMCIGCFRCWDKEDSREIKCVLKDDVEGVYRKMLKADLWIFGTPVYYDNVTALMKIFQERMVMMHNAELRYAQDKYLHDIAFDIPPIVSLASCDLPGNYNFHVISEYMKKVAMNLKTELVGEIYRCEARLLTWPVESMQFIAKAQRDLWIKAGVELAQLRRLSEPLRKSLNRLLIPAECYIEGASQLADDTKRKAGQNKADGYGGY